MAACLRITLAMVILWLYQTIRRRPNTIHGKAFWKNIVLGILLFGLPWGCLFWGEQFVHASIASIINSTVPLFILVFSWLMLPEEQPNLPSTSGVLLGFVGMFWVFSPGLHADQIHSQNMFGMMSVMVMAISYGFGGVMMRRWTKGLDMVWALIIQAMSGAIFLGVASLLRHETIVDTGNALPSTLGLVYLAVCSTVVASLIYYHLIFQWGTLKAAAVTYLSPFVAIFADIIFLNVHPKPNELFGGMLILIGLLLIHWTKTKNVHRAIGSVFRKKQSS